MRWDGAAGMPRLRLMRWGDAARMPRLRFLRQAPRPFGVGFRQGRDGRLAVVDAQIEAGARVESVQNGVERHQRLFVAGHQRQREVGDGGAQAEGVEVGLAPLPAAAHQDAVVARDLLPDRHRFPRAQQVDFHEVGLGSND
jgi:hypothetical protein